MIVQAMPYPAANSGGGFIWSDVLLLSGFEGSNGSSLFADESSHARIVTNRGTPLVTTTSPIIGTSSLDLDAGDGLSVPATNEFKFDGAFTAEVFIRPKTRGSFLDLVLMAAGTTNLAWRIRWATANAPGSGSMKLQYLVDGSATVNELLGGSGLTNDLLVGDTTHVCVERNDAGLLRLYRNGVVLNSRTDARPFQAPTGVVALGTNVNNNGPSAVFDEWRITKGAAVYNGAFTVPAAPFPRA